MRSVSSHLAIPVLFVGRACGQTVMTNAAPATNPESPALDAGVERNWSASASVCTCLVPDERDFAQPTVTFDRERLHLEAHYNYEDLDAGSGWVGYNCSGGKKLDWEITPMLGGVFGDTDGIAPGYKDSLGWWQHEFSSDGECVFDPGESLANFFYNWSELTLARVDWFGFGLVTQRTRVYQTGSDIQRGPLVGFSVMRIDLTACVLYPDVGKSTVVFAVALNF